MADAGFLLPLISPGAGSSPSRDNGPFPGAVPAPSDHPLPIPRARRRHPGPRLEDDEVVVRIYPDITASEVAQESPVGFLRDLEGRYVRIDSNDYFVVFKARPRVPPAGPAGMPR